MDGQQEFLILSDVNQTKRKTNILITYMWNLKVLNELIYKIEKYHRLQNKFMVTKGKCQGRDKLGDWD